MTHPFDLGMVAYNFADYTPAPLQPHQIEWCATEDYRAFVSRNRRRIIVPAFSVRNHFTTEQKDAIVTNNQPTQ